MVESIDWDSPSEIRDSATLEREIDRLQSTVQPVVLEVPGPQGARIPLNKWTVRQLSSAPQQLADESLGAFEAAELPATFVSPFVQFRHTVTTHNHEVVLNFEAVDYYADVFVDGVLMGSHTGYFAPFSVPLTGVEAGEHQVDVVVRRAVDFVRWTGEVEVHNNGDAHGKGLGSVVGNAVTAGAGILGSVWMSDLLASRFMDLAFRGDEFGRVVVGAEVCSPPGDVEVMFEVLDGDKVVASTQVVATVDSSRRVHCDLQLDIPSPHPWNPQDPKLYVVRASLFPSEGVGEVLLDTLGLRTINRLPDGTLEFNGTTLAVRGTTSIGCLWDAGWAGDENAVVRQLLIVRALFGNTLRVHVHVLPRLVYDCADRIGLLIYQDAPLQWHCFEPRKESLDAELEQASDLARAVRHHPSVVILSLVNEMHMEVPFHDSDLEYVRRAHEITQLLAPATVLYQDWSGPSRPRELPQSFHDYPGYFHNTTETGQSVLDWEGESTRAIISEYGGGAVPSWRAMRDSVAAHENLRGETLTLPAGPDGAWTAEEGILAQTGEMIDNLQRMVGWQPSFEAYREASGVVQARILQAQTMRMRRDVRVTGVIQHYLQNPAPTFYNPWIDLQIIDSAGALTDGFDSLREAFRPVAFDVVGLPVRAYVGAQVGAELWGYNDLAIAADVAIDWSLEGSDGVEIDRGRVFSTIEPASATRLAPLALDMPTNSDQVTVRIALSVDGRVWMTRSHAIRLWPTPTLQDRRVCVIGDTDELRRRAPWIGEAEPHGIDSANDRLIVTPRHVLSESEKRAVLEHVEAGGVAVILERPAGESLSWLNDRVPAIVADRQISELAAVDMSLASTGLTTEDLSRWSGGEGDGRVVTDPLVTVDRRGAPVWARTGHRLQMAAIQEFSRGRGSAIVCQMHIWQSLGVEPVAAELLHHLISAEHRSL